MIRELTGRLKIWAGEMVTVLREKLAAIARRIRHAPPAVAGAKAVIAVLGKKVLGTGMRMRYLRAAGHPHAPVFSLFTFFADRR